MDKSSAPACIVAFPSVSNSLNSLPQATTLQNVSIHPNMYAQRAAESEAKLQKALSKTPSSFTPIAQQSVYGRPAGPQAQSDPSQIMMRTRSKFST